MLVPKGFLRIIADLDILYEKKNKGNSMESFFKSALELVKSDEGIIIIVVLFILLVALKFFQKKTIKLNQKQSYSLLNTLWIGLLVFFLFLLVLALYPMNKHSSIENSFIENIDSNISLKKDNLEMKDSVRGNSNSTIIIN